MIKYKNTKVIEESDWSELVKTTYGKPYRFQQQQGCQDRGHFHITIPDEAENEEEMHESIPEKVNGKVMGVKFEKWLERSPTQAVDGDTTPWMIELFWERNFYPDIQTVANDLHKRGLIEAGDYVIDIDW